MLEFKTSKGTFTVQLFDKQAPITVENFLKYAEDGYFDGTMFHRVIPGFMVQGGGMTADLKSKDGQRAPIKNEADEWPQEQARHAVDGTHERHQQRDLAVLHQRRRQRIPRSQARQLRLCRLRPHRFGHGSDRCHGRA